MKRIVILSACTLMAAGTTAFADEKPSDAEAAKIKAALSTWGCEGGAYEKESEASGVFEVDDAKCKDGQQYDIKLDDKYMVLSITRD
jgi:hypothetical protein